jgi:hypothetical protein
MSKVFIVVIECSDSADNYTVEVRAKDEGDAAHIAHRGINWTNQSVGHVYPKYKSKKKK